MNHAQIQLFIQLIAAHTGLQIRPQERSGLSRKLLTALPYLVCQTISLSS